MKHTVMGLAALLVATSFTAMANESQVEVKSPTQMSTAEMAKVVAGEVGNGNAYGPGVGNANGWGKQDPAFEPQGNAYGVFGKAPS